MEQKPYLNCGVVIVPYLETHLAYACNLHCESCSHYSNQGHKGVVSLEEIKSWLQPWKDKIEPRRFNLLGGEPAINKELADIVVYVRSIYPKADVFITTNGLLLKNHPHLPDILKEQNVSLSVSMHAFTPEYLALIKPVRELLADWQQQGVVVVWKDSTSNWSRRYHGVGDSMMPYQDGDQRRSWQICKSKTCVQLFRSALWKCAPLAYLNLQNEKFNLNEIWTQYLGYKPLSPDCSHEEVIEFYNREDESYCSMCPANTETFIKNPLVQIT